MTYRIHVDCSVIPSGAFVYPVYFQQTWTDSTNAFTYHLNGTGADSLLSLQIKYPRIINITNLIDSIGYLEEDTLEFKFLNTGSTAAFIEARFQVDGSDYCGAFDTGALSYRINSTGIPVSYSNDDPALITLPQNDTLIFRQVVKAVTCLDIGCTPFATFTWQCSERDSLGTAFCDSCIGTDTIYYSIQNRHMPQLVITRILPVTNTSANFDVSCPNSLPDMRTWVFNITSSGQGALDSAVISFQNYGPDLITSLGLIPESTIHIDTNCTNCSFQMKLGTQVPSLCSDSVPVSIDSVSMIITDFGEGDTIRFEFKSFRCVKEDTLLYNTPKHFTNWTFENTYSRSKCGLKDIEPLIVPQNVRSSITTTVNDDVHLNLIFTPTVSDLSVAHGVTWGDSADFDVKMNGLFLQWLEEQLLGCNHSVPGCTPNGHFRITIECDTGLIVPNAWNYTSIRYIDSLGAIQNYYPEYYYEDNFPNQCRPGSYVYYFDLNNPDMMRMLTTGKFLFRLQACCGNQHGGREYRVKYDWLINPDGSCNNLSFPSNHRDPAVCTGSNCEWLPLSYVGDDITIHCPGCVTPGIVIRSYRMERSNYGYLDSNDDGFADNPLNPIVYNSPQYLATKGDYGWINSGMGDQLTDYQVAEFAPGDSGSNGYTYPQMQANGAFLNYLQLNRSIRAGLDTMKVQPDTITLYIDYPFSGGDPDSCIDCSLFNVSPTKFHTQRILKFHGASLNKVMALNMVTNEYFYTFSSFDTNGVHQGVLHGSDTIYNSLQHPYLGFFERQQYRLSVHYNVCGNFKLPQGWSGTIPIDAVRIQSDIKNDMWLCGDSLPMYAGSSVKKNPGDISDLNSAGWYIPPLVTPGDNPINQIFADTFRFNCENLDAVHYFYSHGYDNITDVAYVDDCMYRITTSAISNLAGNLLDPYPGEYHPASLQPRSYTFNIPSGYQAVAGVAGNEIYTSTTSYRNTDSIIAVPSLSSFSIHDSSLNKFTCLQEGDTVTGKRLYYGDTQTARYISIFIEATSCDTTGFTRTADIAAVSFEGDVSHCMDVNSIAAVFNDTLFALPDTHLIRLQPNDSIGFSAIVNAQSNRICFTLSISNPLDTFPDNSISTLAPNYFIVVPDAGTVNWLNNWTYYSASSGVIQPMSNQFFLVDTALLVNEIHTGDSICASFVTCPPDSMTDITFVAGWGCSDTLVQPFDTSVFCGHQTFTYTINTLESGIELSGGGGNTPQSVLTYALCDTLFYECCFKSNQPGEVTPSHFDLPGLPPYMGIAEVRIRQGFCGSNGVFSWHSLTFDTITHTWPITAADMIQIGYTDSVLTTLEGITVRIGYFPDCHFTNDVLPDVVFHASSYCNEPLSSNYPFGNALEWDGTSQCHDCFEVTKTANTDTIAVGDTITYAITISSNNGVPMQVLLTDVTPSGFVVTDSIFPYVNVPASGDTTFFLQGYFTSTGTCPQTLNTAYLAYADFDSLNHVTSNVDTLSDTSCVEVVRACITDTTIIFPDRTTSDSLETLFLNQTFFVQGTLYVVDDLTFANCMVYMAPGAEIQVLGNSTLSLGNTSLLACDSMWQGVRIIHKGWVLLENNSLIADAQEAIHTGGTGNVSIRNSSLLNNVTGVVIPDQQGVLYGGTLMLDGANIGMDAFFKPDYPHQPAHGLKPYAGILSNDAVLSIGADYYRMNHFFNMNNGIRAYRSSLKLHNSDFRDIEVVQFYNNGTNQNGSAVCIMGDNETEAASPSYLGMNPNPNNSRNVYRSRCGVYSTFAYTEVYNCIFDSVNYGIDERYLGAGLESYLTANTINAYQCGINLMENDGSNLVSVEYNTIKILPLVKSGIGIYAGESNSHHTTDYWINSNNVKIANSIAGIQTAGVSNAKLTYNTIELQNPGTYTAPSTTGIDIGGGGGNFLSCNHVSGHTVTDSSRYGYRVTQSTFDSLKCNVADSVGYSFRFEGAACLGTQLKGNYMGNAYCGLYLNSDAIIGQQPQLVNPLPAYHGNVWLNASRYTSGFGAVNMNADSAGQNLALSLFITDQSIQTHNPIIPLDTTLAPFHVDDDGWFFPQNSGASFDCNRSNVCIAALQDSGDWVDDQLRMRVVKDSSISSLFIPESKQIASQLIYADLKTDQNAESVAEYSTFLDVKENASEGVIYKIDSIGAEIRTSILDRNDVMSGLIEQQRILLDSILLIDSIFAITNDTGLFQQKDNLLFQISEIKVDINEINENYSLALSNKQTTKEQLNESITPQQTPDANIKEVERICLLYKLNGATSLLNNYEPLLQIAIQCPSSGGPSVFVARNLIKLINDSIVYDDANICMQLGILRVANQQQSRKSGFDFVIQPNPANGIVQVVLDNNEMKTYQLQIFNSLGQDVFKKEYANIISIIQFSVTTLKEGLYTVVVRESNGQQMAQKLVVVR